MNWKIDTKALHSGQEPDPATGSRTVPIYQTSSYVFKDSEDAQGLFDLKPEVWAPRLNLDTPGYRQNDYSTRDTGNVYTRIMNPTTDVLENRMMDLEGGVGALATSSGMSAITLAVMNICKAGDNIVSSSSLYGGTHTLFAHTLPQYGINTKFVDCSDPENFAANIDANTKCLYLETVGNPKLNIPDLRAIAEIAHRSDVPLIVDNTIPSPILCKPFDFGADIVVHSLTKFCGGHGTTIGGIIVDNGKFDWTASGKFPMLTEPDSSHHDLVWTEACGKGAYIMRARNNPLRDMGMCISPFNSFLILQGLETLHLRMERHAENGMHVANYLQRHSRVNWVLYPGLSSHPTHDMAREYLQSGFGSMVGFGINGGSEAGKKFIENLQLFSHLANIGDAKSLAIHPASTTHAQMSAEEQENSGVTPDFIRLSVGIEHIDDILNDLEQALQRTENRG